MVALCCPHREVRAFVIIFNINEIILWAVDCIRGDNVNWRLFGISLTVSSPKVLAFIVEIMRLVTAAE